VVKFASIVRFGLVIIENNVRFQKYSKGRHINTIQGEKKKRRSGLSTLKRKLVGKKKNCREADHALHFKEHFLSSLLEYYEILLAMRDLKIQTELISHNKKIFDARKRVRRSEKVKDGKDSQDSLYFDSKINKTCQEGTTPRRTLKP